MDLTNALLPRKDYPKSPRAFNEGNQSAIICCAAQVSNAVLLHGWILTSQKRERVSNSPRLHIGTCIGFYTWGAEHPSTQGK